MKGVHGWANSVTSSTPHSKGTAHLVAPHRHRRGWLERRRTSRRGRFELALIGGGAIALGLAGTLPGESPRNTMLLLVLSGMAMTIIARVVGFAPALATAFFAPLVIALTDPMWTLGNTIDDFTLANESEATFATFLAAAVLGLLLRRLHRKRTRSARHHWSTASQP